MDDQRDEVATDGGTWGGTWGAGALVFFTSGAVLVLEILAGRLVAPYVGVSIETYTGIIGTVLAGIALGSALGGRLADRRDPRALLGPLLVVAGAASLVAVPVIAILGPTVAARGGGPSGIVTLAITGFMLPTALLSAVGPMAAKLRLGSTSKTGTVVGGLSAAGTAGALVGTFATGFVFVAALPTRPIVIGVGLVLAAAGFVISIQHRRRSRPRAALTSGGGSVVLVAVGLAVLTGLAEAAPSPCGRETRYYCVSVVADPDRRSGRTLVLDSLEHSYVDLEDPSYLEFRYARLFASAVDAAFADGPVAALHIGGGGFTVPRWLADTRPGSSSTVLELDPEIVEIAQRQLGLETGPQLRVRTGDARLNIAEEPSATFDLVVGDAFGSLSVPWHLTTLEMVKEIERTMRPGGIYILNVIDGGPRGLVRAELATLATTFDYVAVIVPPVGPYGNYVLIASDRPIPLDTVPEIEGVAVTSDDIDRFIAGANVLRDDFAPVDRLITRR